MAISLLLDPVRSLADAVSMTGHIDTTGAASLLTPYRAGLEMLLAPVNPGDAEKVPPSLVGELLAVLRTMFDYVVVDTPPQLSEHVLTALDASAHHVLLTTPDVPALKNLRVVLDVLDMLSYPRRDPVGRAQPGGGQAAAEPGRRGAGDPHAGRRADPRQPCRVDLGQQGQSRSPSPTPGTR